MASDAREPNKISDRTVTRRDFGIIRNTRSIDLLV